ncbi:D-sedoheptulose 7-phosphate isomerase [Nannocystis exedens]|uniref:D-sedoheptulose 7-phosphate isomerase n=1 Tax=Nannocystis exedens TaxID=54 RepID=A0A1I2FHR4_9BACT|nr:SIS domain-containing protein [Nannocystis exedens]PCC70439.1 phosphoheptose isomerase [Nannocystis exedens]SFF04298.1 D-sedoheptulose 7-phosphate isomerase [Nannocystis exedens]
MLRDAILRKCRESTATKERFFAEHADRIEACAREMARAFDAGARLFALGNGGSACDAQHLVVEMMHPVVDKRPPLPALALGADMPLVSALGNDRDFSVGLAHELRVLGREGDIVVAISTSGRSANVLRALVAARELGMLTVGFSGRDGGRMAELCDFAFVVASFSIHRIQETHETLLHVLWDLVHLVRGEEDVL